jgi:two-component system sensor histidine kinase DegS
MRLQEAILELRRVIYNLRPLTLDRSGLAPAVEQMVEDFNQVANLRPEVKILGNPYRFSSQAETAAYRIIQESLNNAYKHAQATDVEVEMRFSTDLIEITVADNGKGFPLDASRSENGERMGLIGMHDRAISVGGVININSVEGEGTEIAVAIPRLPPDAQQQDDRVRE